MDTDRYFGPFIEQHNGKDYRCYFYFGEKNTNFRINYGVLVFCFGRRWQKYYFHTFDPDVLSQHQEWQKEGFSKAFHDFLLPKDFLLMYERMGIYPRGLEAVSAKEVYILGQRYPVVMDLKERKKGTFFASSYESLQKMYDEMALSSFRKRGNALCDLMKPEIRPQFELSTALSYLGVNNLKVHRIRLNRSLFAFQREIGDAVIVHEIAHCFVRAHNSDFYKLCVRYCPSYFEYDNIIRSGDFLHHV